jgi:phenylacetate-coenzyme A ligase PaaK-like adenylate-forming protein
MEAHTRVTTPPFDAARSASVAFDVATLLTGGRRPLESVRERRLRTLLKAAAERSPYYARTLKGIDLDACRLADLPITRKPELMSCFDDWVTDPDIRLTALQRFTEDPSRIADAFLGRYVVWGSSGSSGEPGLFVQDASAMAVYDALEALRRPRLHPLRRVFDPLGLRERVAFVGAIGGHFASTVSIERLRRLSPPFARNVRSISFMQPLASVVADLNAFGPTIIATYPSVAVLLAQEQRQGRLHSVLQEIWTGGENLTPGERRFVEGGFNCRLLASYGASEFLSLAAECRCGKLHLNNDWAILESVDAAGRPVPDGQAGATALLTNLANHVQPLIRYDIGDRVCIGAAACECGSLLPTVEVQGRDDDVLHLGAIGKPSVCVLPLALCTAIEDEGGLFDFQLLQDGAAHLSLQTSLCGASATQSLRRARSALGAYLAAQGIEGVRIDCRSGLTPALSQSGKTKRVVACAESISRGDDGERRSR